MTSPSHIQLMTEAEYYPVAQMAINLRTTLTQTDLMSDDPKTVSRSRHGSVDLPHVSHRVKSFDSRSDFGSDPSSQRVDSIIQGRDSMIASGNGHACGDAPFVGAAIVLFDGVVN